MNHLEEILNYEINIFKIDSFIDLLSAKQFEPEVLRTLDPVAMVLVDEKINKSRIIQGYDKLIDDYANHTLSKQLEIMLDSKAKKGKTPYEQINKDFPYIPEQSIEPILKDIKKYGKMNKDEEDDNEKQKRKIMSS